MSGDILGEGHRAATDARRGNRWEEVSRLEMHA